MTDPFHSSKYSIKHAKRHICKLEGKIAAFLDSHSYAIVVETNVNGTEDSHKVKLIKPMPAALPWIAFDAISNLRAALDHAGYTVARAANTNGRCAKFPFGDTLAEAQSRYQRSAKNIPKEIFDVRVALQPYEAGNVLLWGMNKLCNSDKHEIIVPMLLETGSMLANYRNPGLTVNLAWPPKWEARKTRWNPLLLNTVIHRNMTSRLRFS